MQFDFTYTITSKDTRKSVDKNFICEADSYLQARSILADEYKKFKRDYVIENITYTKKNIVNEDKVTVKVPEWGNTEADVNFKSIIAKKQADVAKEKAEQEKRLANKDIKDKYLDKFNKIYTDVTDGRIELSDALEDLFDLMVPTSGAADSVVGECIRALMKILYRDYNDGDLFYSGYGIETCGPAVTYLIEVLGNNISNKFERIAMRQSEDDEYTTALYDVAKYALSIIANDTDKYFVHNSDDMYNYDGNWIKDEWEPREEYDVDVSGTIEDHVNVGDIAWGDVEEWLENIVRYDLPSGSELNRWAADGFTIITNKDGIEMLNDSFEEWCREYANELDDEYPLDEEDDKEDESLQLRTRYCK